MENSAVVVANTHTHQLEMHENARTVRRVHICLKTFTNTVPEDLQRPTEDEHDAEQ